MGVDALRARAQTAMFATLGVPITVTPALQDAAPVVTTGIWMALPPDESRPMGTDFQRREPRKVMAIPRDAVLQNVARGDLVAAAEVQGGIVKLWRVDTFERPVEVDEFRVRLVQTV